MSPVNIFFIILNVCAGLMAMIIAILNLIDDHWFQSIILNIYIFCFGLSIVILEIFWPFWLAGWLGFYTRWLGKGLFIMFVGWLVSQGTFFFDVIQILADWGVRLAFGIIVIVIGALWIFIAAAADLPQPTPFRGGMEHSSSASSQSSEPR